MSSHFPQDAQDERAKEALERVKDSLLTGENDIMSIKILQVCNICGVICTHATFL